MSEKVVKLGSKAAFREMKEEYLRMLEDSIQDTKEIKRGDVVEVSHHRDYG